MCIINNFCFNKGVAEVGSAKFAGKKNKRRKDSDIDIDDDGGRKKMRTTFTGKQIFELEKSFENKKYLSSAERAEMASNLQVTQQQVKMNFFDATIFYIICWGRDK